MSEMVEQPKRPTIANSETVVSITVKGDCGKVHASVDEWDKCEACAAILKARLE